MTLDADVVMMAVGRRPHIDGLGLDKAGVKVGDRHEIVVDTVRRVGRVRYRQSYHDKSPAERLTEQLESVLFLGSGANPLEVRLAAGDLVPVNDERFNLPLHVTVPVSRVTFLPVRDGSSGRVRAQIGVRDERNRTVVAPAKSYTVEEPTEQDGEQRLAFRFDLELAPGPQILGVAVRDDVSLDTSLVTTTINVPKPKGKR